MPLTPEQIESAVHAAYGHYRPEAVKRGRNPKFPYVPIYRTSHNGAHQTTQVKGRAFATRAEALHCAEAQIEAFCNHMRALLIKPGCRALREQYGLPREI